MIAAISFALALFLSTALVPVAIRYAGVLGLVDAPDNERKIHAQPIPRAGGIAIAVAFFLPVLFWMSDFSSLTSFLMGAVIIVIFGFLDDRHNLSYKWKFFGQIVAILVFLSGNLEITKTPFLGLGDLLPLLSYPLLMFFLLGVTNAVNLSDGLDGLAAGSSLLSLGFLAVLAYAATEYSLTLIAVSAMGALMGFLRYNTHPATVFMGDTGSQFLGYIAGCLAILVTQSPKLAVSPMLAVLILGLPILDTLMVMALRLRDRISPFKPDQRHLHHQFLSIGLQHYQAVSVLYLLNFILLVLAYFLRFQSDELVLVAYLIFCLSTMSLIAFFKYSSFSQARRKRIAEKEDRRNPFFRNMTWMHVNGAHAIQYLLGVACLLMVVSAESSTGSLSMIIGGVLLLTFVCWRLYDFRQRFLCRVILYIACVVAVYSVTYGDLMGIPAWRSLTMLDLPIIVLSLFLLLAIRTTRKAQFRMDNQDMLVLLVLLASPLLTLGDSDNKAIIGAIVRLAALLYAAEFLITRLERPAIACSFAGAVFATYLLLPLI